MTLALDGTAKRGITENNRPETSSAMQGICTVKGHLIEGARRYAQLLNNGNRLQSLRIARSSLKSAKSRWLLRVAARDEAVDRRLISIRF